MYGYKCFNSDMTNLYGDKFEVGKKYSITGEVRVGTKGNGFHICENFEDTLKYFGALNDSVVICEVIGSGEIVSDWDDYYGYEKFAVSNLEIVRVLSREEIIQMGLQLHEIRADRFVQVFKLTDEEIPLFEEKYGSYIKILKSIEYYQKNNKHVYEKDSEFESEYFKTRKRKIN